MTAHDWQVATLILAVASTVVASLDRAWALALLAAAVACWAASLL